MSMNLGSLSPAAGSRKKSRRLGRGHGSGRGKTAGKGTKGQKARAGASIPAYFQGGSLGLVHGLPTKRGTHFRQAPGKVRPATVNLRDLEQFTAGSTINRNILIAAGLIDNGARSVKILGEGALLHPLTVEADAFSEGAKQKIEQSGGTAIVIGHSTAQES